MRIQKWRQLLVAALCFSFTSAAFGDTLNIDLSNGQPVYTGEAAAPDVNGAAAIWNAVDAAGLTSDLVNSAGALTSVGLNITRNGGCACVIKQEQMTAVALMGDYIYGRSGSDTSQQIREASISGLLPGSTYDLYFYGQGDVGPGQNAGFRIGDDVRQTNYDGVGTVDGQYGDGLLVEDIEYVKFTGIEASVLGIIEFDWFNPTPTGLVDSDTGLHDVEDPTNTGAAGLSRYYGFNGLQIVGDIPEPQYPLILEINSTTGQVTLQNNNSLPVGLDDYSITTDQGTLSTAGWTSLKDQGIDAAAPGDFNSDGNVDAADYTVWRDGDADPADYQVWKDNYGATGSSGWAEAGAASSNYLGEFFLGQSVTDLSAIGEGEEISLGSAFNPSVLGAGVSDENLVFEYYGLSGESVVGTVSWVSGAGAVAAAAVPEPSAGVLAVLLAALAAVRRKAA